MIRLRERILERLTRVYKEIPLREQGIHDKKLISLEVIENEENFEFNDHLLYIRILNSEEFTLSDRFELIINEKDSLVALAQKIFDKNQSIQVKKIN